MKVLHSDIQHLPEVIVQALEYEKCRISVCKSDSVVNGLCTEEYIKRNISASPEYTHIASIIFKGEIDTVRTIEISFHEKRVRNGFTFIGSGNYTRLGALSGDLERISEVFTEEFNLPRPDFKTIDSASISREINDGLADREFTYELIARQSDFKQ